MQIQETEILLLIFVPRSNRRRGQERISIRIGYAILYLIVEIDQWGYWDIYGIWHTFQIESYPKLKYISYHYITSNYIERFDSIDGIEWPHATKNHVSVKLVCYSHIENKTKSCICI